MGKLIFNSDTHEYFRNGVRLFGVTEVLDSAGLISDFAKNDIAAHRGTAVHLACKYLAQNSLDWESIDERILGHVRAYEKFAREMNIEAWKVEEPLCDEALGFAGTFDIYGFLPALGIAVVDIKTGAKARYHGPQLAAYQRLIVTQGWKPADHRLVLRLSEDGRYALDLYKEPNDWKVFLSALNLHRWKNA